MKIILKYLKPFSRRMSVGFGIKVTGTIVELFLPYILSHILKNVVVMQSVKQIVFWGGLMILCAGTACLFNVIANRMASRVARDFSEQMRKDLFAKMLRLSAAQTDRFTIPSLESRITTDTYNVHHFVGMMQRMGVRAPILLLGGTVITLIMDRYLALVMLVTLPFIFGIIYFISRKGVPLYSKVQQSVDKMIRVVREDVQGIRVIKALSKTDFEHRRYDNVNQALVADEKRAGTIMGSVNPLMTLLMNMGIIAVITLSASRVAKLQSDPETVIAFMQYFTLISMAMMTMSRIFVMFTKSAASAKRIAEVMDTPEDLVVESAETYPVKETEAHIVFDKVSFAYGASDRAGQENTGKVPESFGEQQTGRNKPMDLEDASLELPKGGTLGIIGATGSGKSTLVKLLLRFYDVTAGAIYINGRDIRTIPIEEFCGMFGTAMQYDFLYVDTIEENIRFGRDLSHEQIEQAAKVAQAHEFIAGFADGYEHMLSSKATNISGGQKQRLLIARAIAANPEILILDDSSSALDYKTDANLRQALAEHLKDTTIVTVAQRVSSIKNSDLILVLEEGRIIGKGTHEELLQSCQEYREISDSQMGGAFHE